MRHIDWYTATAHLRDEIVASLLGMAEAEVAVQPAGVIAIVTTGVVSVTIDHRCQVRRLDETAADGHMPHAIEDGWQVTIGTRSPSAAIEMIHQAWKWCEGSADRYGLIALHEGMMPGYTQGATEMRARWERDEASSSSRVVTLSGDGTA